MKSTVSYIFAWLGAAAAALAMAFASPNEASVMGKLPSFMSHTLMRQPVAVPEGLPSERTLALITFQRSQRAQAESWITGLKLPRSSSSFQNALTVDHGNPQMPCTSPRLSAILTSAEPL